ncbi:MAG: HD domain-containing protein [Anaerolineae bacterium]|nr:HD domain-containing protein [Anaerolineae bacterium]
MPKPDLERAKHYALNRLENELPPTLYYHSLFHTRDDVVPATERFAEMEHITGDDLLCLRTAAYFHDLGHIENSADHEERSVRMVNEVLPGLGYTRPQLALIGQLIMATKLPQDAPTLLAKIIVDADMDSLGRDDFLKTSLDLKAELEIMRNETIGMADWYTRQLTFVLQHRYFTEAARKLREEGKQRNIKLLERLLVEARESET